MKAVSLITCSMLAVAFAPNAEAQTKLSAKMTCGKPDQNHTAPVGDTPDHVMMLQTTKCTWSSGDVGGDKLKNENDTFTSDVSGGVSHDKGYGVGTLASGDKYYVEFKGTTTLKGENPTGSECKWHFNGGTGKLKGLTGKGTCKGTFKSDGTGEFDIEGDYKTGEK
jgi:hypothetical protein